jgi:predicted esterase
MSSRNEYFEIVTDGSKGISLTRKSGPHTATVIYLHGLGGSALDMATIFGS